MADLNGYPLMQWVLGRCQRATLVDEVVLATTEYPRDDALVDVANALGVAAHRGSESDVLGRFAKAARLAEADVIVRVCGDRPLIDPKWTDLAIEYYLGNESIDLAFNHVEDEQNQWPRGFGVEVFSADLLYMMDQTQVDAYAREHVTPAIWQNQNTYSVKSVPCPANLSYPYRLDVDEPEDLERVRRAVVGESMYVDAGVVLDSWSAICNS